VTAKLSAAAAMVAFVVASQAHAETCAEGITKLTAERNAALVEVSKSSNPLHGLLLFNVPVFCANAERLHSAEESLIAFMVKNKAHCAFPDDAIAQLVGHMNQNKDFADSYCKQAK
jgi:hypothetical protein